MDEKSPHGRSAALGVWTTLALFTAVVASRRVAGAYTGPLTAAGLSVAVLLAALASCVALWMFRRDDRRSEHSPLVWLPELTAWSLPTLFALVITAQPTAGQLGTVLGFAGLGAVAIAVAVLETTAWWESILTAADHHPPAVASPLTGTSPSPSENSLSQFDMKQTPPAVVDMVDDEEPLGDESTTQWMTRRQDADGEAIEGTVRVEFAPGQREAIAHVTFCPPLATVPDVELECVDGEDWQLKSESALPYGLRIQIRRSTAVTLAQSGIVAYLATSTRTLKAA